MWLYVILKYALLAGWVWSLVRLFTIKKLIEIDKLRKEIKSISKGENNTNDAEIENLKHQVEILRYLYFMKNRIQTEVLVGDSNKHYLNQTLNNQPYSSNVTDRPRIEEYIGQGIDSKEKVATIVSKFFTINAKNL